MKQMTIFTGRQSLDIKLPVIRNLQELHVDNYLFGAECCAAIASYYPTAGILRIELHAKEPANIAKKGNIITYFI